MFSANIIRNPEFFRSLLVPWNVEVQSPDEFLIHQFQLEPTFVLNRIKEQAAQHGGWERLMTIHRKTVPGFVALISQHAAESR